MARIGVISDTHNFFDPRIPKLFAGVDHILHGGDIGNPSIISQLEEIAPVTAVLGNTDDSSLRFRETEVVEIEGRKFLVHHIVNPVALMDSLKESLAREKPDAVIFGHTHKPYRQVLKGILFFNPGYAGGSRFGMDRSVAVLTMGQGEIEAKYFGL
jgi:putative phosphoesterase